MFYIGVILVLFLIAAGVYALGFTMTRHEDQNVAASAGTIKVAAVLLFLVLGLLYSAHRSVQVVGSGEVGVLSFSGVIQGKAPSGLDVIPPWLDLQNQSVKVQKYEDPQIDAASSDTQNVYIYGALNYQVDPGTVQTLFRTVGPDWFSILVEPRFQNDVKDVTSKYAATSVVPDRDQIGRRVADEMNSQLAPYSVSVSAVLLKNIWFDPEFDQSIREKVVAQQEALKQKTLIQVNQYEAQQAIATAQGDATSTLVRARAQANANALLSRSLTSNVIAWQSIQKLNPNVKVIYVPKGGGMLLSPGQ